MQRDDHEIVKIQIVHQLQSIWELFWKRILKQALCIILFIHNLQKTWFQMPYYFPLGNGILKFSNYQFEFHKRSNFCQTKSCLCHSRWYYVLRKMCSSNGKEILGQGNSISNLFFQYLKLFQLQEFLSKFDNVLTNTISTPTIVKFKYFSLSSRNCPKPACPHLYTYIKNLNFLNT